MLAGALVCPHPPLLLPGLTGAADVLPELRAAIADGLGDLTAAGPDRLVLIGAAGSTGSWKPEMPGCTPRFRGGPVTGPVLPLSLSVGQDLLDGAGWRGDRELRGIASGAAPAECLALGAELAAADGRIALLVLGDGSARRDLKAPGYLDPRAAGYDEQALRGLSGDTEALRSLDPDLGAELLVAGRAPWQVLAGAADSAPPFAVRIRYADDPFGVYYVVSSWAMA